MKPIKILITATLAIAVIAALFVYFVLLPKLQDGEGGVGDDARGVFGEPLDVSLDFYQQWTEAKSSTSTDPYTAGLADSAALGDEVQRKIKANESAWKGEGKDVVACDASVSATVKGREVFNDNGKAQVLIFPKNKETRGVQVVISLAGQDGYWKITDIGCGAGEQDMNAGEFSFDYEGHLLKQSVPAPLNPEFWHLVFTQGETPGYTAPLIFSSSSVCVLDGGVEKVCSDDLFYEAMKVRAKGSMTEAGLEVQRVELAK